MTRCRYGDPLCSCQDGDPCYYEGENPLLLSPGLASALARRIDDALEIVGYYGGIDGGHHKQWVLDQVVRRLSQDYDEWVREQRDGEDGPETYDWDEGTPP
jgi:hypothetical protein